MGNFLHEAIGLHGTSKFRYHVLKGGLGVAEKEDTNFVEAYELLQHMQKNLTLSPVQWITDTISDILSPNPSSKEDIDSDSDSEIEPEESDPEEPWPGPLDHQPEYLWKYQGGNFERV